MTIIDYTSLGLGQYGKSLFPAGLEVCVDSNADTDCSDFEHADSDVDADVEPESANSVDLPSFDYNSVSNLIGTVKVLAIDIVEEFVADMVTELDAGT